jgi:hypothetical protein
MHSAECGFHSIVHSALCIFIGDGRGVNPKTETREI